MAHGTAIWKVEYLAIYPSSLNDWAVQQILGFSNCSLGLFAFIENERGFWLAHSVPKLSMKPGEFVYPETSKRYAQHFFCISLDYSALKTIGMLFFNSLCIRYPGMVTN